MPQKKKKERKKRPLETKEGFPAFKGLSNILHKIDQNNVRLNQGLVAHLNPKTIVGVKSKPTKLVKSLDFRQGLLNFNKVIKVIENVTSLKGKIFVNIKQDLKNQVGSRRLSLPNLIFFPSPAVLVKPCLVEHFREICDVQWKEYVLFP